MESMLNEVKKINRETKEFLNYLETYGNECAYTDRMIENIIQYSHELEKKYHQNENFDIKFD